MTVSRKRRKVADDPRLRVRRIVENLLKRVKRCGDQAVFMRMKKFRQDLVKKQGNSPNEVAGKRLIEIDQIDRAHDQKYDLNVQRELLLIVLSREVDIGRRIQAGSMLVVDGDQEIVQIIHKAYPGLMPGIVAATK